MVPPNDEKQVSDSARLHHFLNPRSIAVIGASASPHSAGFCLVSNLLEAGFQGKLYPINPRLDELLGLKAYPSIKDVSDLPDLAIIAIRAPLVPQVLSECGEKRVKAALVVTDGFADDGEEGKRLQQTLTEVARAYGVRVIGPNTQGLINTQRQLVIASVPLPTAWRKMPQGKLSLVGQTALFYWDWLLKYGGRGGLGISKGIDLGNMCDVDHGDALEYLLADSDTEVIGLHMETIREASRFLRAAESVAARKPVVVLKAGRSPEAQQAMLTHTGSLAGDDRVFDAVFRQKGITRAEDPEQMQDLLRGFLHIGSSAGGRVAILTFSGAAGALAADLCMQFGLRLAQLSPSTIERIMVTLPSWASVRNPFDFMQAFEAPDFNAVFVTALDALLEDSGVDTILVITLVSAVDGMIDVLGILRSRLKRGLPKPVALWPITDEAGEAELSSLEGRGFVVYPSMRRAIAALAACYERHRFCERSAGGIERTQGVEKRNARQS